MPISNRREIAIPRSGYQRCLTGGSCGPNSGTYWVYVGRNWSGNQRRVRRKFNPPTACSSSQTVPNLDTINQGACGCATKPAFNAGGPHGPGTGPYGEHFANRAKERSLQSRALARFSSNAGLGVTLAETTGTLRSLGDRLGAVAKILAAVNRGDIRKALSVLHQHTGYNTTRAAARLRANPGRNYADRASNFWLETVFGWVPLIQSIFDSLEVLGGDYRTVRRNRSMDSANGLRVGIVAEFKTSGGNRFSKLGITNPAEIAWDLVPFSFVLDWFVPIGNSIRYLGVRSLTRQIWMWSSREWGNVYTMSNYQGAPSGTLIRKTKSYSRSVSQPSAGTFTARLPATMWHAVTSAALIQSLRPR